MWTPAQEAVKRGIDVSVSLLSLIVASWLLIIACLISAIETRSTGIFMQDRVGRHGRVFRLFKIRTMVKGRLSSSVTTAGDPRVTRFGRLMRAAKIDELPQLVNVLLGSMSLVGPRPTVSEDVERMDLEQRRRHDVRPGLTGLAQVNGNTSLSWPERIQYDLQYVDDGNLFMDLEIIWRTVLLFVNRSIETHPAGDDEWTR